MSEGKPTAARETTAIGPGRLVLVVGPSGAGKDTLLRLAKFACANDETIVFPRRFVTRAPSAAEDNIPITQADFARALERGDYAAHWEAHGLCYGLPAEINSDIRAGRTVVVNVSRTVIAPLRQAYADVVVVAITAPLDILAERLATRARGSDGDIQERLSRSVDDAAVGADATIVNSGSAEEHSRDLLRIIRSKRG